MLIVSFVFNFLMNIVFPSLQAEYETSVLFRPWSDPIMMLFFIYPFILAFALAWFWSKSKKIFKGNVYERGMKFGFSIWVISGFPGMLITYSTF